MDVLSDELIKLPYDTYSKLPNDSEEKIVDYLHDKQIINYTLGMPATIHDKPPILQWGLRMVEGLAA